MKYQGLKTFVHELEKDKELIRLKNYYNPELEITELADRVSKLPGGGKALLFENNGTGFPLLINALGSRKRVEKALRVSDLDDLARDFEIIFHRFTNQRGGRLAKLKALPAMAKLGKLFPKIRKRKGACQAIIHRQPDLFSLPILKCWPHDGGRFITLPLVHTLDPETGNRNIGMYRMQVFDKKTTGMHWHPHKTGAKHYRKYQEKGLKMPVAVVLGGDPVYTYSATAPLPEQVDEYLLAGYLRNESVKLVKCITQDIHVPDDADIVIEGYVDPGEDLRMEGPFGDHTGFYSLPDYFPAFHITCITHRKDAVYPATIVGVPPQEDAWIALATEKLFLAPIRLTMLPEIIDMHFPVAGVAHNLTIVKIEKEYPGHGNKVISALWGAGQMMLNKLMIVVDGNVDPRDYASILRTIVKNVRIPENIFVSRGTLDILDHASPEMGYGGKMGLDATTKAQVKTNKIDFDANAIIASLEKIGIMDDGNFKLLEIGVPIVIIGLKDSKDPFTDVVAKLSSTRLVDCIQYFILVDKDAPLHDFFYMGWIIGNHVDMYRDTLLTGESLFIDARNKSAWPNIKRPWPNPVTSHPATIQAIDDKWETGLLGKKLPSPSREIINLVRGEGATVKYWKLFFLD